MRTTSWISGITFFTVAICASVSTPALGLDGIYYASGQWQTGSPNSNQYIAVTHDGVLGYHVYAARPGSLDEVKYNSGWSTTQINTNTYTGLTYTKWRSYYFFGARAGGLDAIQWDSQYGWSTSQLYDKTYTALAPEPFRDDTAYVYGARAGGVDSIQYDSVNVCWVKNQIDSGTYTALVHSSATEYCLYGAAADGLYVIQCNTQTWQWSRTKINSNVYTALTPDAVYGRFYGARSGSLDMMYWNGSSWVTSQLNSNTYTALATDATAEARILGARSGSLDTIYNDGANWLTTQLNSNTYVCLTNDATTSLYFYGSTFPSPIYVDKNAPGPTHDGSSWTNAYLTIQAGINAVTGGRPVWVKAGTYTEHISSNSGVSLMFCPGL